jgi:hypothetical protein
LTRLCSFLSQFLGGFPRCRLGVKLRKLVHCVNLKQVDHSSESLLSGVFSFELCSKFPPAGKTQYM